MLFPYLKNLPPACQPQFMTCELTPKGHWLISAKAPKLKLKIELGFNEFIAYCNMQNIPYDITDQEILIEL